MYADINECDNVDSCSQVCHNFAGGYNCSCNNGYKLISDGRTCEGMAETSADTLYSLSNNRYR